MLPNEILKARLVRGVQRFFSIQGEPPTPQLDSAIQPGLDLSNPPPELWYLLQEKLIAKWTAATGDATHPGVVQLLNPTGSGILVILEGFYTITPAGGLTLKDSNAATVAGGTNVGAVRDSRWFPQPQSTAYLNTTTTAADPGGSILMSFAVSTALWQAFPYILAPGNFLSWVTGANAQQAHVSALWRERPMESLEARF